MAHNTKKRPRLVYPTPGRECSHADKGCCPKCLDSLDPQLARSVRLKQQLGIK